MLVINNTVFYPQRSTSSNSYEQKSSKERHSSIELNMDNNNDIALEILDNCITLGDAIHEPELFLEKNYSEDFICVICQCICNTPYDIGCKNGHIYCKTCLNAFFEEATHGKCPQCQDNVNRYGTRINHFALRLLLKLRILCPFSATQCHDEKQIDMYQCEWIGCYSDIIEHLKSKCKYGTFINNATIQAIRDKYNINDNVNNNNINTKQTNINNNINKSIWEISRAELTSYKVFWEQICDSDQNLGNHVNKKTISEFYNEKLNMRDSELQKLWWIVGESELISENQFYAALHIARLHTNKYKPLCSMNELYSLPNCLTSRNINKIRYNINISIGSASDLEKVKDSVDEHKHNEKKKQINLNTRIGTIKDLKTIAGIYNIKKRQKSISDACNNDIINWNITKQDINNYKKWFIKADLNKDGYIDGNEARQFFTKSKLSGPDLGKIWQLLDHDKNGRLTEAQFYAFFHIVWNSKKIYGKLPNNFTIPLELQTSNILNVMNGNTNDGFNQLLYESTANTSSSNILDSIPSINFSNTASEKGKMRSDSIDSVHDWADFSFEF
eukprot:35940_1